MIKFKIFYKTIFLSLFIGSALTAMNDLPTEITQKIAGHLVETNYKSLIEELNNISHFKQVNKGCREIISDYEQRNLSKLLIDRSKKYKHSEVYTAAFTYSTHDILKLFYHKKNLHHLQLFYDKKQDQETWCIFFGTGTNEIFDNLFFEKLPDKTAAYGLKNLLNAYDLWGEIISNRWPNDIKDKDELKNRLKAFFCGYVVREFNNQPFYFSPQSYCDLLGELIGKRRLYCLTSLINSEYPTHVKRPQKKIWDGCKRVDLWLEHQPQDPAYSQIKELFVRHKRILDSEVHEEGESIQVQCKIEDLPKNNDRSCIIN